MQDLFLLNLPRAESTHPAGHWRSRTHAPPRALYPALAQARRKDTLIIGLTLEPTGLDLTAKPGAEIAEGVHYNM